MKSRVIIAVTHQFNDNVSMLPPSFEKDGVQYIIHKNPNVEFNGTDIVKNFDFHIDFSLKQNKMHKALLKDCYWHSTRQKRFEQFLNVYHFNREHSCSMLFPKSYLATERAGNIVMATNYGIPDCVKVVIKEQYGAKGSNQIVVPTNMLVTLLKHGRGMTYGELRQKFPDLIYTENSDWDKIFCDKPTDLFISELLTNIDREYRLLVSGNKIYGRSRVIKQGPYPQANLETDKWNNIPTVNYDPIEEMFDKTLVNVLYKFIKYVDMKLGSIDLFFTKEGEWGIFEYSTQYAFHGADPSFIRQLHVDALVSILQSFPAEINLVTSTNTFDLATSSIATATEKKKYLKDPESQNEIISKK